MPLGQVVVPWCCGVWWPGVFSMCVGVVVACVGVGVAVDELLPATFSFFLIFTFPT